MKQIRQWLSELGEGTANNHAFSGLTSQQIQSLNAKDFTTYTGKVRDVVRVGDELLIVHSDRLSAFDKLIGLVPYKGTILTAISEYWLREAQKVVPTHLVSRPQERVLKVLRAEPVKAEIVVRGYLAGSMMRAYANGERVFCGAKLVEGLKPYGKLPKAIITPTTKAAAFEHDENVTPSELIASGACTAQEWDDMSRMALTLFEHGQKVFGKSGWLLVDTKYEIGRTRDGRLTIIDEIHTPDSSRLWVADTYAQRIANGQAPDMLDKENVRRYLLEQGFSGEGNVPRVPAAILIQLAETYLTVAETLIGRPLLSAGPGQGVNIEAMLP